MEKSISLNEFYKEFQEQVMLSKDANTYGWQNEDFMTAVMLEYLEDAGEVDSPIISPFRGYGLQLNAYSISDDYETVDLFVSIYNEDETMQNVSKGDIDATIKRAIQLFRKATNDLYTSFEKDNDTYEFAISISKHKTEINSVRIIALTNGIVKPIPFKNIVIDNTEISFSIWDIDRLYRCCTSGKMRETIEIDFYEKFGVTIPCIENTSSDKYHVYLAIISGELLAQLYLENGARLLERNVRSFLQVKGQVNKGIRDTLKDDPDMFLAYNNGISVTAEDIEIIRDENERPSIKKIRDMQIVNGGQTTASIYNAKRDKKISSDLSKVYVQMKVSVIKSLKDMDDIVPKISAYANTQNKVQMADFSANDLFHRKMEEHSRITWAPARESMKPQNWFYERARGQYVDMLSRESTPLKKKKFKENHPLFTKTDLAKYENSWDQLPYYVSEGAQKNFKRFTVRLNERGNFVPDSKYYEHLIAKAILFRSTEKIVQAQKYGGYRANIVTYTIAFLSYKTAQRIDLDRIWKEQKLSDILENEIVNVSKFVHLVITNPPNGANIGEWCKKIQCWNSIKNYDYPIKSELEKELISVSYNSILTASKPVGSSLNTATEEENKLINTVREIPAVTWFALSRWAKETNNFQPWQRSLLFSIGTIVNRKQNPSYKQAVQAHKIFIEAVEKGFQ